ncbi:MAG: hypothetical protein H6581_31200 [Bacteroidia bacterium]|nr:hypothetical protein [Bacteroidia bacterium]
MRHGFTISLLLFLCLISQAQTTRMYLCAGQSNAKGRGNMALSITPPAGTAFEYSFEGDSLLPLADPVGEDFWGFQEATDGSIWPAFASRYHDLSGRNLVIVPAAKGGTVLHPNSWGAAVWGNPGTLFNRAQSKTHAAEDYTGLQLDGVIWLQGENDGVSLNWGLISQKDYEQQLKEMIGRFRDEFGCDLNFYIIQTGLWDGYLDSGFVAIRNAQANVAAADFRTWVVYDSTVYFPNMGYMTDPVHYNQKGLNRIGLSIARRIHDIESTPLIQIDSLGFAEICAGEQFTNHVTPNPYFAQYVWSNGDTGLTAHFTQSGPVFVTGIDSSGCDHVRSDTLFLTVHPLPPTPVITTSTGDTSICFGDTLTLYAPSGYASYAWNSGFTGLSFPTVLTHDWSLTVSDNFGCESQPADTLHTLAVALPTKPSLSFTRDSLCLGDSVVLEAPGGYSGYHWNDGELSQEDTVWAGGDYFFQVEDMYGCLSPNSDTLSVTQLALPAKPILSQYNDTTLCLHDSMQVFAPGGFAQYHWINQNNNQSVWVTQPEMVSARVIDQFGCRSPYSDTISITKYAPVPEPQISLSGDSLFCDGDSVILSGPSGYAVYDWSNGNSTQNNTIKVSGNFQLVVTDNLGCYSEPSDTQVTIAIPLPAKPSLSFTLDSLCLGDSVVLEAPGGFAGYHWNDGILSQEDTVWTGGDYFFQVEDIYGCLSPNSDTLSVTQLALPAKPILSQYNDTTLCSHDSMQVFAPGGFAQYHWINQNNIQSVWVNQPEMVSARVIDQYGCRSPYSDTISITKYAPVPEPQISLSGDSLFCDGDSVILSGPSGYAVYDWSNGNSTQNNTIKVSGNFQLVVTDSLGCYSTPSRWVPIVVWTLPPSPTLSTSTGDTLICSGDTLALIANNGYDDYLWNTSESGKIIETTISQAFYVVGFDSNGCASPASNPLITNAVPTPAKPVLTYQKDSICAGDSLVLEAPSGFAAVHWSDGNPFLHDTIWSAGDYFISVENSFGCVSENSDTLTVTVLNLPVKPILSQYNDTSLCSYDSLWIAAPMGWNAYHWINQAQSQSQVVTANGSYAARVIDNFGCRSPYSDTVQISFFAPIPKPQFTFSNDTTLCQGDSVVISAPPGYANYTWSNGSTQPAITLSSPGSFQVQLADANGCISPLSRMVPVVVNPLPGQPWLFTSTGDTLICAGDTLGLYGPGSYAGYIWNNGATSQQINVTQSGSFNISVIDGNGCVSPPSAAVNTQAVPRPAKPQMAFQGNDSLCLGDSVVLLAPAGFAAVHWSDGNGALQITDTVRSAGNYYFSLENQYGCVSSNSDTLNVTVLALPPKAVLNQSSDTTICPHDYLLLYGPSGYPNYYWYNGATTGSMMVNTPGNYAVRVIDQFGCRSPWSDTIQLSLYAPIPKPQLALTGDTLFCDGDSVLLAAPGGFAGYAWSNGDQTQGSLIKTTGIYSVVVTDSLGCHSPASRQVPVVVWSLPPQPVVSPVSPIGICTGQSITLNAPAGYAGYAWTNGSTQSTLTVSSPGTWQVTVTDGNGCVSALSDTVLVYNHTPLPQPWFAIIGDTILCQGEKVILAAPGGYAQYHWSNGTPWYRDTVTTSGIYSLVVEDIFGCQSPPSQSVQVVVNPLPPQPLAIANGPTSVCQGDTVWLQASPGGYPVYNWNAGHFGQAVGVTQSGPYSVFVVDVNGCASPPSNTIQVQMNQVPPTPTIIYQGQGVLICTQTGNSYQWFLNGQPLAGQTNQTVQISGGGAYQVVVYWGGCPSDASAPGFLWARTR